MRLVRKSFTLLLIWSLIILPISRAIPQEQLPLGQKQAPKSDKLIILSDKVGEIIDLEERNYYMLPLGSKNFRSAIILQLPDSSMVIQITEMKKGKQQQLIIPVEHEILEEYRGIIETICKREKMLGFSEREQEGTYRGAGGLIGFVLGAAAGMLIGKGIQEKKVKRTEYHPGGDWGDPSWTEEFYSYKNKYAPHWGAVIGGISGAVIGYSRGKKADKQYNLLVPENIRMQTTKSSGFGNFLFGFGVTGPLMGIMTGYTLYTPESNKKGVSDFGGGEFVLGYLTGAIIGMNLISAYKRRAKHIRLWQNSIKRVETDSSYEILPLDPTAFSIYPRMSPSGEIFYEYRMDILRIRF